MLFLLASSGISFKDISAYFLFRNAIIIKNKSKIKFFFKDVIELVFINDKFFKLSFLTLFSYRYSAQYLLNIE